MEQELLKKVQQAQLEIAKEIRRVCRENDLGYFLCCGTLLGAVRHQGFIPWDDDLDMGMLRKDYERFCRIALEKLDPRFVLQNWYTDPKYPLPFAKVRMRNTTYIEAKGLQLSECGVYVDLFPFDFAPEDERALTGYTRELAGLFRIKLMKAGSKPWMDNDRIQWKKRVGYLYYQLLAQGYSLEEIGKKYDRIAAGEREGGTLIRQRGQFWAETYPTEWFRKTVELPFEDTSFCCPTEYHQVLTTQFGEYMTLPPEDQRENRHQIVQVDLGEEHWKC